MTDPVTRDVSRYAPGTGWAVVRYGLLVVLPTATAEQAAATWEATADAHGVMEALQAVSESFGTSLAALPPFAVVVQTGRRAHVVVRGDLEVSLAGADGTVELHGRDVTTWVERTAEQVDGVRVVAGSGRAGAGRTPVANLPTIAGVLRTSVVERGELGGAASVDAVRLPVRKTAPNDAAVEVEAAESAGPDLAKVGSVGEVSDESVAGPSTPPAPEFGATFAPEETLAPGSASEDEGDHDQDLGSDPASEPAAVAAAEPASDDYAALWGSTILRSVEDAAMRPEDEEVDENEDAAPSDDAAASEGPMIAVPQDWSVPAPPLVPAPPEPAPAAQPAEPAAADGVDHDGQTVLSSSITELQAVAAAAALQNGAGDAGEPATATGPQIVARVCAQGHANPPQRERCAVCGAPVVGDARPVARPPLGRVRVSTGQVVDLDRPVVVGRRPRSPRAGSPGGASGADLHRIVTVPSPEQDVSRSHLEVRLEGWHVLAVDLNTTNGTTLRRQGQAPLRLHPGEPVLVVSGDVIDLGDGATLAFEDVP